jgi:hypothetical protein
VIRALLSDADGRYNGVVIVSTLTPETWGERLRRLRYRSLAEQKKRPSSDGYVGDRQSLRSLSKRLADAGFVVSDAVLVYWMQRATTPTSARTRGNVWAAIVAMGGDPEEFGLTDADAPGDAEALRLRLSPFSANL